MIRYYKYIKREMDLKALGTISLTAFLGYQLQKSIQEYFRVKQLENQYISGFSNMYEFSQNQNKDRLGYMQARSRCMTCWLCPENCMCNAIDYKATTSTVEVIVYMHWRELYRSSNTGKLLLMLIPNAKLMIYGNKECDKEMMRLMADNSTPLYILFPSSDASDLKEVKNSIKYFD